MSDLLDRVLGLLDAAESHRAVPYDSLLAAMREIQRGNLTQNQVVAALELTAGETTALTTVYNKLFGGAPTMTVAEFEDLMVLGSTRNREDGSQNAPYYSKTVVKNRLGL
jgi:hypothetical protein